MIQLDDGQRMALNKLHNGCILCGGVGSGKSRTAIAYYYITSGGDLDSNTFTPMDNSKAIDLYIITTARKRDTKEWEDELAPFLLSTNPELCVGRVKITVDSWNNIAKYKEVTGAFFIFDEQRVVGYGQWSRTFIRISRNNKWILLSATPGDTWKDYIPVFVANGFYKNKSQFEQEHIRYKRFSKYPQIEGYDNVGKLNFLLGKILVDIKYRKPTERHFEVIGCEFDRAMYRDIWRNRWNPYTNEPIVNAGELCYTLRRVVNSDESHMRAVYDILDNHDKVIIFYNYDYELELLRVLGNYRETREWNGHKHEPLPLEYDKWIYLVQYTAGCEGWNCTETDTIIFYSQTYSYKQYEQACGRIDRRNTPFTDLYYYTLRSRAGIDISIGRALEDKKNFNERAFASWT